MAKSGRDSSLRQNIRSLRSYTTAPINKAMTAVEAEREVLVAEKQAFEELSNRVADLECESSDPVDPKFRRMHTSESINQVRTACRETILNTDHYDDTYGETLFKHVRAEFGSELAHAIRPAHPSKFTPYIKRSFVESAEKNAETRTKLLQSLQQERDSLATNRRKIVEIVESIERLRIPEWFRSSFLDDLEALAETRQQTLRSHANSRGVNGEDLCAYLYREEAWKHPVLVAIGRLRESVIL